MSRLAPGIRPYILWQEELTAHPLFFFYESRDRDGPSKFLGDYSGCVTVDAYVVNDGVYLGSDGRIVAACCHSHASRKFEVANSWVRYATTLEVSASSGYKASTRVKRRHGGASGQLVDKSL